MPAIDVSIVIPNWNGRTLLERFLPSVLAAARRYEADTSSNWELLVVDDGSADDSVAWLRRHFPTTVRVLSLSCNSGFAAACNAGFEAAQGSTVLLLNNDVCVGEGFVRPLIERLTRNQVFAATARVFEMDSGIFCNGGKVGVFRRGFWSVYANYDVAERPEVQAEDWPSLTAIGGFSAFRKDLLDRLGGFSTLLSPFHWEDIELSYRAWKRGWTILYEPRSIAFHNASSTIAAHYRNREVERIAWRNRYLFHWIHVHRASWWLQHWLWLPLVACSAAGTGHLPRLLALADALALWRQVRTVRAQEKRAAVVGDAALANRFRLLQADGRVQVYRSREEVLGKHPACPLPPARSGAGNRDER
ncbi:MAG: glycosyltransferase family 2 protein [Acidobacteria bacterium]|nr:glycosyltransferase family 2 protein [Acidobacteriota bacterium]